MPTYAYVCRDISGAIVRGRMEAVDPVGARARLQQQGLFITSLRALATGERDRSVGRQREQVTIVTRHLAMLLESGLPVFQALAALVEQSEQGEVRDALVQVTRDIEEGTALSAALERHPNLFSPLYVGVVRSGETSGRLEEVLDRLAAHLERELEFRRRVRDAAVYPAFVLALAAAVLAIFLVIIIPAFDRVYRSTGATLPPVTQVLLVFSRLARANVALVLLAAAGAVLPSSRRAIGSAVGRALEAASMRLPVVKDLAQTVLLSRLLHTLGTVLRSGVSLLPALAVAREAVPREFVPALERIRTEVSQGKRLQDGMRETGRFPPMILRMVALGEESGRLDLVLVRAGTILDREFDFRVKRLLALLEPVLTLVVGAVIGFLMLALYMPIFGLSKALAR